MSSNAQTGVLISFDSTATRERFATWPTKHDAAEHLKVWCIACEWGRIDNSEHEVRADARAHRANPGNLPLLSETGRLLFGQDPGLLGLPQVTTA